MIPHTYIDTGSECEKRIFEALQTKLININIINFKD